MMKDEVIDHTEQLSDIDTVLIASQHITEEDIPDTKKVHLTMGMEEIDGTMVPAVNCWELSIKENGGLVLFSHAPINVYPAYPHILFDVQQAKDMLTFLQKHEALINENLCNKKGPWNG